MKHTWNVIEKSTGKLIEGGFFDKEKALEAADELMRESRALVRASGGEVEEYVVKKSPN